MEWAVLKQVLTFFPQCFLTVDIVEWAVFEQVLTEVSSCYASYLRTSWSGQSWCRC